MASSPNDWFEQGNKFWANAQQDYWKNWMNWVQSNNTGTNPFSAFSGNAMPGFGQGLGMGQNAWSGSFVDAFNQWQQMFAPQAAPDPVKEFMDRTTEIGKSYLQMADNFYKAGTSGKENHEEMIYGWLNAMQEGFKQWKNQLESGFNIDMPEIFGFEKIAMQSWQQLSDNMMRGMTPQDWEFPGFSGGMFPETGKAREQLNKMLGTPALGYSRERQEKVQRLVELLVDYGEALKAYKIAFAKNGMNSVKAMKKKLSKLEKPIDSMRGLYDFWVDVNEGVYAKFAMSDEYQVIYGDLVNSQMAVQRASNDLMEDVYKAMNLPTQSDMEAVVKKLQHARRENRQLRKQFAAMNKRLDALEQGSAQKPAKAKAEAKKAAVKGAEKDDLTQIKGIGPKMQEQLYAQGVTAMAQLAGLSEQAISDLEESINSAGRIAREQWVKQAKAMLGED